MKERIANWYDRNRIILYKCLLLGALPLVCCVVHCLFQGRTIAEVYLPMSEWNDELFYFKQVEGILEYGYPRGYFGFNESHALKLSFAAWSPILVLPWILMGAVFGWSMLSPIVYNIFFLTVAVVVFVVIVKPSWKQCGVLTVLFCVYTPFVRYMLSTMPEIICFSLLIVYTGCFLSYRNEDGQKGTLVTMFVIAAIMTLMRPYLILFMVYPISAYAGKRKWEGVFISVLGMLLTIVLYALIKVYLGAEYFTPLYKTEWITPFLQGDFFGGIKNVFVQLYYNGYAFMRSMLDGIQNGTCEGAIFAGYIFVMMVLAIAGFMQISKRAYEQGLKYLYYAFCFFAMWMALLLMYKLQEGSKHLLTFMAAGLFVIAMMETKRFIKPMLLALVFLYLYTIKAWNPYDYQVPFVTDVQVERLAYWKDVMQTHMEIKEEELPSYENVCIWVFTDGKMADWQILYSLPKGFGISCCFDYYVEENFATLQSRYVATPMGGDVEKLCIENGWKLLGQDGSMSLYQR